MKGVKPEEVSMRWPSREIYQSTFAIVLLGVASSFSACSNSTGTGGLAPMTVAVRGTVRSDAGSPVSDATVNVWANVDSTGMRPKCAPTDRADIASSTSIARFWDTTGADGRYVLVLNGPNVAPIVACLWTIITPPAGSGLAPDTLSGPIVTFAPQRPPPDTLQLDIVLRAP